MDDLTVAIVLITLAIALILFWPALIGNSGKIRAWFERMLRRSSNDQEMSASPNNRRSTRS